MNQQKTPGTGPRSRGATFFGVMLATVIISLAVIPLVTALIKQTKMTRMSRSRIFATHLVHSMLERLRLEPYSQVKAYFDTVEAGKAFLAEDTVLTPVDAPADFKQMLAGFERSFVFVELAPRCGSLEASVTWIESGHPRCIRLATLIVDTDFPGGKP